VTGFVGPELPDVLALADVVISRSGAGTIAELTALGKASVLIPLPTSAADEQRHNARHLAALGAAVALDGDVTPDTLKAALGPLLADPARRAAVAAGARAQGRPDAADRLADAVLAAAGRTGAVPGGGAAVRRLQGLLAGGLLDEPRAGGEGIRVLAPRVGHVASFGVQAQLRAGAVSRERAEFGQDGAVHGLARSSGNPLPNRPHPRQPRGRHYIERTHAGLERQVKPEPGRPSGPSVAVRGNACRRVSTSRSRPALARRLQARRRVQGLSLMVSSLRRVRR
jgi:hypothetical protein